MEMISQGDSPALTPRTPPTLSILPPEIILRITHHIDRPSALALAVVSRKLTGYANERIFRDLDFTVEPFGGEPEDYSVTQDGRASDIQLRRREALRTGTKAVLEAGSEKLGKVQTIKTIVRTGSVEETVALLSCVAPNLRSLEVDASHLDVSMMFRSGSSQSLHSAIFRQYQDLLARDLHLSFPCLTSVRLGLNAIFHIDLIPLLCNLAPALTTLDCCLPEHHPHDAECATPNYPRFLPGDTKITHLGIACYFPWDRASGAYTSAETLLILLERSPMLRALSLAVHGGERASGARLMSQISKCSGLEDLYFWSKTVETSRLWMSEQSENEMLPLLRRIAVSSGAWTLPSASIESCQYFPSLELVLFQCLADSEDDWGTMFPPPSSMQPLDPSTARWLRQRPRLHLIQYRHHWEADDGLDDVRYLDYVEDSGHVNGRISSMRHGSSEVILARFLLHYVSRADDEYDGLGQRCERVICPAWGPYERIFRRYSDCAWQDMSDFEGQMVPMEVLERMREAEDVGQDFDWDRRGVEVGDAAWKVLTDWREGLDR